VIVAERGLVAAEGDVILGARQQALLDALADGKILGLDRAHQEVEVPVPVALGLVGRRRLRRIERRLGDAVGGIVADREGAPELEVIGLPDER